MGKLSIRTGNSYRMKKSKQYSKKNGRSYKLFCYF